MNMNQNWAQILNSKLSVDIISFEQKKWLSFGRHKFT